MIHPVSLGAGASLAPLRPGQDDALKRLESAGKRPPTVSDIGAARVDISPAGVLQSRADVRARAQLPQPAGEEARDGQPLGDTSGAAAAGSPPPAPAPAATNSTRAAGPAPAPSTAVNDATDLAFAAADGNQDGTVTISEQDRHDARTVGMNRLQPADGRPGPAGSGPIRAYLAVDATLASI